MCQEWIDKLTQFSGVYALAIPRMQLCRGRLKLISGNPGEGLKLMRKSQQLAAKMHMPYDEALALMLLSKHTKSSVRESQQVAQEALAKAVKDLDEYLSLAPREELAAARGAVER